MFAHILRIIHIISGASNYQSFLLQTGTPISQADAGANFLFAVGDFNHDGIPDLYCLKLSNTGTGNLEVHILSGASHYQSFLLQTGTPITQADAANFDFAVDDFNRDGFPDLYCLKRTNTGTQRLETHVLNGAVGYLGGFRFTINIIPGNSGAWHQDCSDTVLNCDSFSGIDANLVRMLVVAEAAEVFMNFQGNGWDCGASIGEGLSRRVWITPILTSLACPLRNPLALPALSSLFLVDLVMIKFRFMLGGCCADLLVELEANRCD